MKKIDKNIVCFCVGSNTEKKARTVGFQNTIAAEGNVLNLKELILRNFKVLGRTSRALRNLVVLSIEFAQQLGSSQHRIRTPVLRHSASEITH